MKIAKLFALILCLTLAVSLCACGGGAAQSDETTTAPTTEATTEAVEQPSYKITVVDEAGKPFAGLVVQLCNDTGCNPAVTDENGMAIVSVSEYRDDYHANVTNLPEGYEYATGETEYFFGSNTELTITLKAISE